MQKTKHTMLVIDLALKQIGWALFSKADYKDSGTIRVTAKTTEDRLDYMTHELLGLLEEFSPDEVYVECTYKGSRYVSRDPLIRLQRKIRQWCMENRSENAFHRIRPEEWRKSLGFPAKIKSSKELKRHSVSLAKQYLNRTVTDDEADAVNAGRVILMRTYHPQKGQKLFFNIIR